MRTYTRRESITVGGVTYYFDLDFRTWTISPRRLTRSNLCTAPVEYVGVTTTLKDVIVGSTLDEVREKISKFTTKG